MKIFLLLFFNFIVVSTKFQYILEKNNVTGSGSSLIDELNDELKALEPENSTISESEGNGKRRLQEMDLEPPVTYSKIVNIFYGNMLLLMQTNREHEMATIAKYTNSDTQILLCEQSIKSTMGELRRFIQLLHHYFKEVKQETMSVQPKQDNTVKFQVKYLAKSVQNTEVRLEWHGEAHYDTNKKYYMFSMLDLKGDCTKLPNEIPEHPSEPKENFINRLQSNLTGILFNNQKHPLSVYQDFTKRFMIDKTRVQLCDRFGENLPRNEFSDYLFKRYEDVESFTDHAYETSPFSDYQTHLFFSVVVTWKNGIIMKDTYVFRVEEERERGGDQGWKDWWATWAFVKCPANLTPRTDPEALKKVFMNQVCGSIPLTITNGPSAESRATFLSHFMQKEEQGFHAQICEDNYKPIYKFSEFEKWLATWTGEYDGSKLAEAKVESYENFSFICVVDVMKNYGDHDKEWKKREFKMKAYFEVDRWLVKETKIGCDHF